MKHPLATLIRAVSLLVAACALTAAAQEPEIRTPAPGPAPHINSPAKCGCRPGHPFLYRIPATGQRPMRFAADDLPAGLELDPNTGVITGVTPAKGAYAVTLRAANGQGRDARRLDIVAGDTLALTPPMGWNDWYSDYRRITDERVRDAADRLVASGMADAGYQYVDIDDCWARSPNSEDPKQRGALRDSSGNILPNDHFPDMRALTDYIHSKGLKAGIYSSPGPLTCAGFAGSYGHEAQDARQFADWGFDLLKYDWCSYKHIARDNSRAELERPYRLMGRLIHDQDRDILLNLCQYGMGSVWEWGREVGGQSWRTSDDLGLELNRFFEVSLRNVAHREWSAPGSWNDPDYIQIGWVGAARAHSLPRPVPLSAEEQYSFMSLWCLQAAPLFYSGDLTHLDRFTLNILCNPEVIAVDQDALGQCARVAARDGQSFVLVKEMADGSKAVGLCNAGSNAITLTGSWRDLGISGRQTVRDLWRERDLGTFDHAYSATVPARGVVLVRLAGAP